MNENAAETNGSGTDGSGAVDNQYHFALQRIYVKDLSFEVPGAPEIFGRQDVDPEIQLNLKNSQKALGNDNYEVILNISVHAKMDQQTVFLIELDQAGIFAIKGYPDEELKKLMGTYCPTTLFPYAREIISSTVAKGGFPPLTLQPINFDALYAQAAKETAQA
jgi:preprotein translocase subunit SecB